MLAPNHLETLHLRITVFPEWECQLSNQDMYASINVADMSDFVLTGEGGGYLCSKQLLPDPNVCLSILTLTQL